MDPDELGRLREVCARVAARTDIRDIRFESLQADLEGEPVRGRPLAFELKPSAAQTGLDGEHFGVVAKYAVSISQQEDAVGDESEKQEAELIARINVRVAGLFRIDPDGGNEPLDLDDVTSEELEAYARSTGLFALHPYARQAISTLSVQLGLPVLEIPVLKITTGQMGD